MSDYSSTSRITDILCSSALFVLEPFRDIIPYIYKTVPHSWLQWVVQHLPSKRIYRTWEIAETLSIFSNDILASKRAAIAAGDEAVSQQIGEGKDLLSVLCTCLVSLIISLAKCSLRVVRENLKASDEERMSDAELIGHMS